MALFMALSTSGRSSVRVRTPSFDSERTGSSAMAFISALASPLEASGLARTASALASPLEASGLARTASALASPLSCLRQLGSVSAGTSEILPRDDAAAVEIGDLVVVVARLLQNRARVLAEERWWPRVGRRGLGEADG